MRQGRRWWNDLSYMLVPALLFSLSNVGYTGAVFTASVAASSGFTAVGPPDQPLEQQANIGRLHVGDGCRNSPLGTITAVWPMDLSVTVTGWLASTNAEVWVSPSALQPGETATVYFTKWAVGGPSSMNSTVTVTSGGSTVLTINMTGQIINPAGGASPPYPLWPGCESTRRSGSVEEARAELDEKAGDVPDHEDESAGASEEAGLVEEPDVLTGEPGGLENEFEVDEDEPVVEAAELEPAQEQRPNR